MVIQPNRIEARGDRARTLPSVSPVRSTRRPAYCPLCGQAREEMLASAVRHVEEAVCPGRCEAAWRALAALRLRESASGRVAARRQDEYASQQPHPPALSELLLYRWRAGDWALTPEDVLAQIQSAENPTHLSSGG